MMRQMKLLVILATLAGLPIIPHHAAAAECVGAPDQAYHFDVRLEVPPARLNRNVSRADLRGLAPHGQGANTLGLMRSRLELSNNAQFASSASAGGYCYWVQSIEVVLQYRSLDILVASEYRRDSCAFRAILSHERDHVRVAREYLARFEPRFRQALNSVDVPTPGRPAFTTGTPKKEVQRIVGNLIQPVYEELNTTMARAQGKLDTPEQYARIQARCNDW